MHMQTPECGIGSFKPRCLRTFASIKWFAGIYSISGLLTASLSVYIVSQITTIEKQFGLSSSKTGYLMACNDIGYCIFILFASYFSSRVNIPLFLCLSTILYGVSGILCSIPHFLFKSKSPGAPSESTSQMFSGRSGIRLCENISDSVSPLLVLNANYSVDTAEMEGDSDTTASDVTMALIAIGMIIQGIGKAPRSPMLGQYLDDNTKDRDTGFYMGIITSVAIFGPAIAYGLGGVFSQIYVTLEDVNLHPKDPRWIGAWWLGFLVFGALAVLFALPLMLFPSSLRRSAIARSRTPKDTRRPKVNLGSICREIGGVFKSIYRVLRIPAYSLMLVACVCNVFGYSTGSSFGPKYIEKMYNVPAWYANVIIAAIGITSVCLGSFFGGLMTKKIKLNPLKCILLLLATQIPAVALSFVALFLNCEQPQIHNWPDQRSAVLPTSCSTNCDCDATFLPVCDTKGNNYFSPCHAGCSQDFLMKFTNCSCVPDGVVTTGICKDNCTMFWPFMIVNFLGTFLAASLMMPVFIYNIRIVPNELKSMAIGISSLFMSLFAWIPGPVVGGKLVDQACLLWSNGNTGSCTFYDLDTLRYNLFGTSLACRCLGILFMIGILRVTWNMKEWPNHSDAFSIDFVLETNAKQKQDALIDHKTKT